MGHGYAYFAGETAELPDDVANDLAELGIVRLHSKEAAKPAETRETAESKKAAAKETR